MAKKMVVVDDLTGNIVDSNKAHTGIALALEDREVVLDLSDENYIKLQEALHPFLEAGELKGQEVEEEVEEEVDEVEEKPQRMPSPRSSSGDLKHVREWAQKHGYKVSERGRIPYSVMDAFTKAHLPQSKKKASSGRK